MKGRVLIITYYWPPSGGAGVQRWLKFAKYLPEFNWQPVIYTPENPEIPVADNSLLKDIPPEAEILKTRIWEPYEWYKKIVGRGGQQINTGFLNEKGKGGILEKASVWLRGNLFIPDARKYWIKPSVHFLLDYLKKHPVDAIISTGPPHSMHLIALQLKQTIDIKWIADFRDPWTNIDYYQDLMLTRYADRKHHALELSVLKNADEVIAIGKTMAQEFEKISSRKVHVITNGFDDTDIMPEVSAPDQKFTISHIGTLVKSRNPELLWKVLSEKAANTPSFAQNLKIALVGKVDFTVRLSIKNYQLDSFVEWVEYLPHDQISRMQQSARVLLLVLNNTPNAKAILTGKLFEYLAAKRPILCIGSKEGDAAEIIEETGSGIVADYDNEKAMEDAVDRLYNAYLEGKVNTESKGIMKYSRKQLTKELTELLN